jgi:chromosome segregation ATPase
MKTTTKPKAEKPPAKQTKAAEIARLTEENESLRERLEIQDRELKNHRMAAARHDEEVQLLSGKIAQAMRALRPLHDKTKNLKEEEWPAPQYAIYGKLSWGDIREAARIGALLQ